MSYLPRPFPTAEIEEAWDNLVLCHAIAVPREGRARQDGPDLEIDDPRLDWLEAEWETYGYGPQGQLHMLCPFKDEHSLDSGESECSYFPAGTKGYEQGHYVCLHATCQATRGDADFDAAVGYGLGDFDVIEIAKEKLPATQPDRPKFLNVNVKTGEIPATIHNVMLALENLEWFGMAVALDEFRDEVVFSAYGAGRWRPLEDNDYTIMRRHLELRQFKPVGPEIIRSAVYAIAKKNRFDSAKDWLASLKWDGIPRVNDFLADCFGAEPGDYASAISRYWLTAHVARILYPGCRCDMVPILVSPEGRYKSSALQAMVPHLDQFVEIDLEHKDAELSRKMRGSLLGELAELRGLSGRSAEANKAWVTRRFEEWRPLYLEKTHRVMRRTVFVGTTNEEDFLDDSTGERRWLPIVVREADRDRIRRGRGQLWAEAREIVLGRMRDPARSEEDAPAWEDAYRLGVEGRAAFIRDDGWFLTVARWLASWEREVRNGSTECADFYTLEEIFLEVLGLTPSRYKRADEQRVGKILRALGLTRKKQRVHGRPMWVWCPSFPTVPNSDGS